MYFDIAIEGHFIVIIYCTIFLPKFKAFLGDFYKKITPRPVNPCRMDNNEYNTNIYTPFFLLLHTF